MSTVTITATWPGPGRKIENGDLVEAQVNVYDWPRMSAKKRAAVASWLRDQARFLDAEPEIGATFRARKITPATERP